ncbi:MAG TPA: zinc-binding dehydrogenase [Acidimicrobiales bacterium]|nr:zinc-binding dehydrogenase [Acidimicrobiales bacterium]
MTTPESTLQIRSLVTEEGTVELYLDTVPLPPPGPDQVVVRVDAAPINPSDLGLLFAGADMTRAATTGSDPDRPKVSAPLPAAARRAMAARVGVAMAVGNEGAGTVVATGSSPAAAALQGRTVAVAGGAMYSQYRVVDAAACLVLPDGVDAAAGASSFVNPMTVLGMVETMRMEGHTGLVHTAAASNLGQMLNRVCQEDGVPLVNVVRRPEQARMLRDGGARWVCDSSAEDFMDRLIDALAETGATVAFDAVGGGRLAGQILTAMEAALTRQAAARGDAYSRYGTSTHKQVYIYGSLDRGPTEIHRSFGMAWAVGGWLLTPFLQKVGRDGFERMRQRVAAGIRTTFASSYTAEVTLAGALDLDAIAVYGRQATGAKYLIRPGG